MPRIRSDDGPRRLRNVYLGPPGVTLLFEWTYLRWIVTILILMVVSPVIFAVFAVVLHPVLGVAAALMLGVWAAVHFAGRIAGEVNTDEPIAYKMRLWRAALRRRERPAAQTATVASPPIGGLSPGATRALR